LSEAAWEVMAAMWRCGSDWLFAAGTAPGELFDPASGETIRSRVVHENIGKPIGRSTVRIRAGSRSLNA